MRANDLRIFLEVARRGRLTEAAQVLGLSHTTVGRHISQLERSVGQHLFIRESAGWTLTDAGLRLLVHAEAVDAAVQAANEAALGASESSAGSVRLVAPDGLATYIIVPSLGGYSSLVGGLTVEVVTANRHASLTTREFDLAVTIERPDARGVHVRKLADYDLQFYASSSYLDAMPRCNRVEQLARGNRFIWYVDQAVGPRTLETLYKMVPDAHPAIQTNSIAAQVNACVAGLGLALLPSFIGDRMAGLHLLPGISASMPHSYWLLTPHHFDRLARVRVMTRVLQSVVGQTEGLRAA